MANLKNTNINNNLELPQGTTAQRPQSPQEGQIRYNTDLETVEFYNGTNWRPLSDTHAEATGGTVVDTDIGGVPYRIHYFTETGTDTLTVTNPGEVEYLIVAGGGGGGDTSGGGGGAGGLVTGSTYASATSYSISVGNGGLGSDSYSSGTSGDGGEIGGDSSAFGLIALGGGGGGSYSGSIDRIAGGSGGGVRGDGQSRATGSTGGAGLQPSSASGGFGNKGGDTPELSNGDPSSGGGGAGSPGQDCAKEKGGNGGQGIVSNITGSNLFYAGGAGGSGGYSSRGGGEERNGIGGLGGGGNGGRLSRFQDDPFVSNGSPNTGGGGGGNGYDGSTSPVQGGGNGGSGIVIVRYPRNSSLDTKPDRTISAIQPNRFKIVQDRLIYHFDAGSVIGYSGSGNTIINLGRNTVTSTVNGAAFVSENRGYFEFDGSNDLIDTNLLFDKDDFTYAAWFRWAGNNGESSQDIIDSIDNNSQEWARIMIRGPSGEFWWVIDNDGSKVNGTTGFYPNIGEWHYGVGVWTRSSGLMEAYINGDKVYDTTHPNTSTIVAVNSENIGSNSRADNEFFNGDIAQAQIYNKALTATEVRHNFNADRGRYGI